MPPTLVTGTLVQPNSDANTAVLHATVVTARGGNSELPIVFAEPLSEVSDLYALKSLLAVGFPNQPIT